MKSSRIKYWIGNHAYWMGHLAPAYFATLMTLLLAALVFVALLIIEAQDKTGGMV